MFKTLAIKPQEPDTVNPQTGFLSLPPEIMSIIFSLLNKDGQLQLAITCKWMCATFRENIFIINPKIILNLPRHITLASILNSKDSKTEQLPPIANIAKKSIYIKDEHLKEFLDLLQKPDNPFKELRFLDLTHTNINDAKLKAILEKCTNLTSLILANTTITAEGLKKIAKLTKLTSLNLKSCKFIIDEGLKDILEKCPNLTSLNLAETNITDEELRELRKALPNCNIIT